MTTVQLIARVLLALGVRLLAALGFRLRGGGFYKFAGTQRARLAWGATVFLVSLYGAQAPLWVHVLTGLLAAASMIDCGGHGEHQDLGRMPIGYSRDQKIYELLTWPFVPLIKRSVLWPFWQRELFEAALMSWIGFWRGVATVPVMAFHDPNFAIAIVLGYVLQGPMYWLGYRVPWTLPGLLKRSSEWGELLTGLGVALFVGVRFV